MCGHALKRSRHSVVCHRETGPSSTVTTIGHSRGARGPEVVVVSKCHGDTAAVANACLLLPGTVAPRVQSEKSFFLAELTKKEKLGFIYFKGATHYSKFVDIRGCGVYLGLVFGFKV